VPDAEVPTDWVIKSVLFRAASKEGIKYYITGGSFRTEGTTPITWTYQDGRYVKSLHKLFGTKRIKSFPIMGFKELVYYLLIKRLRTTRLLYYCPYNEKEVLGLIRNQLGWKDYGGKHHESTFTNFFQAYYLTRKFNIDKRKLHFSALIRTGQMTREEALAELQKDPFVGGVEMLNYTLKKLGFSQEDFTKIMEAPVKSFRDYKTYYNYILKFRKLIQLATKMEMIPEVVYQKYFNY
jgi:hypothetical protein